MKLSLIKSTLVENPDGVKCAAAHVLVGCFELVHLVSTKLGWASLLMSI